MKHLLKLLTPFLASLFIGAVQAQTECPSNKILRFTDGATGCMTEFKYFNLNSGNNPDGVQRGSSAPKFIVAQIKNPNLCPVNVRYPLPGGQLTPDSMALNRCEDRAAEVAQKNNQNPAGCECEIIYHSGYASNVPFSKPVFEAKTRAWMAASQNSSQYRDQFTEEEKKANTLFLAEYLKQLDGGPTASPATQQANTAADKKLQDELAKKLQLDKEQKDLAEKARLEKEKSLAEEKRLAQEIAQKGQLDKEVANKARLEKEKSLAEEKRLAQELAKVLSLIHI